MEAGEEGRETVEDLDEDSDDVGLIVEVCWNEKVELLKSVDDRAIKYEN